MTTRIRVSLLAIAAAASLPIAWPATTAATAPQAAALKFRGFDNKAPTITVLSPKEGNMITETKTEVVVEVPDDDTASVKIGGKSASQQRKAIYGTKLALAEGDNQIEITATDEAGNETKHVLRLNVDTTPPDLVCPGNATFECGETVVFGEATATDNCDPDPEVTFDDVTTPGDCPQAMTIERTWTATDACGNSKSCVQTISIVDSTPPLILCPSNATFECDEAVEFGEASATDNCDTSFPK